MPALDEYIIPEALKRLDSIASSIVEDAETRLIIGKVQQVLKEEGSPDRQLAEDLLIL